MNAELKRIAQSSLESAYDGSKKFPEIVGTLIEAGFEGYKIDYRRNTSIYYLPDGDSIELHTDTSDMHVSSDFNAKGIMAAIKEAQSNAADYSYKKFCEKMKNNGCAGYFVSFSGKRVLYFGRTAETHVEHFPQ